MDAQGNVYISDTLDHRIRIIDTKGIINTIAGDGTKGYRGDGGPASRAEINTPEGITVDTTTGKVFWVETGNNLVRMYNPADGTIRNSSGNPLSRNTGDTNTENRPT